MQSKRVAVVGSGPAGLMAAWVLSRAGIETHLFEKNRGPARKLLIAGSSGLNLTNALPPNEFVEQYHGEGIDWKKLFKTFSPPMLLDFAHSLGQSTYRGTSGRYFVRDMKASNLLRAWLQALKEGGVAFHYGMELANFNEEKDSVRLSFKDGTVFETDFLLLALGGASSLKEEDPPHWQKIFHLKKIPLSPFASENCGFNVSWKKEFVAEVVRAPLKNVLFSSHKGAQKGDILITDYGVEGTPIYSKGATGECFIDLKPDLTHGAILERMERVKENLSPLRRLAKAIPITPPMRALLFHYAPLDGFLTNKQIVDYLKNFPLILGTPRSLVEAISSSGGVPLTEITESFALKRAERIYAVGEMLDWSAPTGGFLIQACVSQGYLAAQSIVNCFSKKLDV